MQQLIILFREAQNKTNWQNYWRFMCTSKSLNKRRDSTKNWCYLPSYYLFLLSRLQFSQFSVSSKARTLENLKIDNHLEKLFARHLKMWSKVAHIKHETLITSYPQVLALRVLFDFRSALDVWLRFFHLGLIWASSLLLLLSSPLPVLSRNKTLDLLLPKILTLGVGDPLISTNSRLITKKLLKIIVSPFRPCFMATLKWAINWLRCYKYFCFLCGKWVSTKVNFLLNT